jgi:hypothetical protein
MMILSMFWAHLVGDYVLQWDKLAMWKSQSLAGVTAHCLVVAGVTALFALPFDPFWWEGVLLISVGHFLIDASQLPLTRRGTKSGTFALGRFLADQVAHVGLITAVLLYGGYLPWVWVGEGWNITAILHSTTIYPTWLLLAIAYTLLAMPAWVIIEFTSYGLIQGTPPDFSRANNKYIGTLERWLMMTFVLTGQLLLVPLVAAPRLIIEMPHLQAEEDPTRLNLYMGKLLASILLAVSLGLALRYSMSNGQ